jgi:hypothetical protein
MGRRENGVADVRHEGTDVTLILEAIKHAHSGTIEVSSSASPLSTRGSACL